MNQNNQNNSQESNQPKATGDSTISEIKKLSFRDLRPSNLGKEGERRLDTAQFSEYIEKDESNNSDGE